jgi:hypothetical protein
VRSSGTSQEAAESIRPFVVGQRRRLLEVLFYDGPLSDAEAADRADMSPDAERPRRIELWRAGLIEQVGVGLTKSDRRCALWGVTINELPDSAEAEMAGFRRPPDRWG